MRFLRKLLPQTIATQVAVLVAATALFAYIVTALAFYHFYPRRDLTNTPSATIAKLALTAKFLDSASGDAAQAAILQAAQRFIPNLALGNSAPSGDESFDEPTLREVQRELGERFQVFAMTLNNENDLQQLVGIRLSNGQYLTVPVTRAHSGGRTTRLLLTALVFLAVATVLVPMWVAQLLTAPLAQLAKAAESFKLEQVNKYVPERGPKEILRAAKALNDMQERISRLVRDRSRMLASISHDLRTPITRLRLRAEEINEESLRAAVIKDLEIMQGMIRDALTFLESGTVLLNPSTIDVSSVVQTICDDFNDLGHDVRFVGSHHVYIRGDADKLSRAITNLVENGVKFGSKVQIRFGVAHAENVIIEVEDNGPGIPDTEKTRVLEPFYRSDSSRSLNGQASFGLGLSICRTIAETHNGTLELIDARPHGLIARLTLPRKHPSGAEQVVASRMAKLM